MAQPGQWGDGIVLAYASRLYKKAVHVLMTDGSIIKLPISSAECERGFSQMDIIHTSDRQRLLTDTVSDLMMLHINGPTTQIMECKICGELVEIWETQSTE